MTIPSAGDRGPRAIVDQDGAGDDRCRRDAVISLDDSLDPVGGEDLQGAALGRSRQAVGVLAQVERAGGALVPAIVTDRLGDGEDMRLGEGAVERSTPVAAGAEAHQLPRLPRVRVPVVVLPLQADRIHQQFAGGGPARQGRGQC